MTFTLNEPQKRWEFREGARLVLTFSHDGYQYITDRIAPPAPKGKRYRNGK